MWRQGAFHASTRAGRYRRNVDVLRTSRACRNSWDGHDEGDMTDKETEMEESVKQKMCSWMLITSEREALMELFMRVSWVACIRLCIRLEGWRGGKTRNNRRGRQLTGRNQLIEAKEVEK